MVEEMVSIYKISMIDCVLFIKLSKTSTYQQCVKQVEILAKEQLKKLALLLLIPA